MPSSGFSYPRCCHQPLGAFYLVADVGTAPSNVSLPCEFIYEPCMFPCKQRMELRLGYILLCQTANRRTLRVQDRPAAFAPTIEVQYLQSRPTLCDSHSRRSLQEIRAVYFPVLVHDLPISCAQIRSMRAVAFFRHHASTSVRCSATL